MASVSIRHVSKSFAGTIAARFRQIGNAVQGNIGRAIGAALYEAAMSPVARARPSSLEWPAAFHKRVRYTAMEEVVNGAHRRAAARERTDAVLAAKLA